MNLHLAEIATEASAAPLPSSGQIGGELELAVSRSLEEQHLFPVLKKHKETKNLVQDALRDNREVRKLLGQLERTLKDDENFLSKVMELRKVFQQHVRDEKKELLPAVAKALSDTRARRQDVRMGYDALAAILVFAAGLALLYFVQSG